MKKNLLISVWFTLLTTVMFGFVYPLAVTGLAQILFHDRANGQLIEKNGKLVGSRIIGQTFTGPGYFHSRPSAAGTGYDPTSSGGSYLAPTNKNLLARTNGDVQKLHAENPNAPIPVDLVTTSGSGLDPDISPAAAEFQIPRVARFAWNHGRSRVRACAETYEGSRPGISGRAPRECSRTKSGSERHSAREIKPHVFRPALFGSRAWQLKPRSSQASLADTKFGVWYSAPRSCL
jgi:K+-transporting ATPase ATPase C chain